MLEVVYSATDPPIKALRRFIPPLRLGAVTLDTSFLLVLVVVLPAAHLVDQLRVLSRPTTAVVVPTARSGSVSSPCRARARSRHRLDDYRQNG